MSLRIHASDNVRPNHRPRAGACAICCRDRYTFGLSVSKQ